MFVVNTLVGLLMNCYVDFRLGDESSLRTLVLLHLLRFLSSLVEDLFDSSCHRSRLLICDLFSATSSVQVVVLLCFFIFLIFYKIEWHFPQRVPFCALLPTIDFQFRMDEKKSRSSKSNKHNLF
jgi:hypothetical protein